LSLRSARQAAILTVVASVLFPSPARAAEGGKRPGRYRIGPFYATPKLLMDFGVDSNVFAEEGTGVSDMIIDLAPQIVLAPAGRRVRVSGIAALDINHFVTVASERSVDRDAAGRLEVDVGRQFTLIGAGGRGNYRERFSFEEEERIERHESNLSGGLTWRPAARLTGSALLTRQVYDFEGDSALAQDVKETLARTSLIGTLGAQYALTRATSIVGSWESFRDDFDYAVGTAPTQVRSSRVLGGLALGRRAIVRGKLMAGVRHFPPDGGVAPYDGLALSANLAVTAFGAQLTGLADRDVLFGVNRAGSAEDQRRNTYVWTRIGAEVLYELPWGLLGRTQVGRERANFLLPFQVGDTLQERVDRLWTVNGSVKRQISPSLKLGLAVEWQRRSSNFPGSSSDRLRWGVQGEYLP
jgi:hypothetical protein